MSESSDIFGRDAPDTVFTGYPANPKAGYRISGNGRIPDIRPDTWLDNYIFGKISTQFIKTALKGQCHEIFDPRFFSSNNPP
jgi:hypothetical protein